jgi:hypothetical protein
MRGVRLLVFVLCALALGAGCTKKEEKATETVPSHGPGGARKESTVVIPASVKGKWKAVKIAVTDKLSGKETVYTVEIGNAVTIPGSGLTVKVDTFLPHFVMEGTTLTSQSNEPKNPAAQIRIMEDGKEIFKGWLFSLYPTTHTFQHTRYGFTLVDFIPAG